MDINDVVEWLLENFDIRKLIEKLEEYVESESEDEEDHDYEVDDEDLDYEVDEEGFFSLI